jgi:hypothetical protein
MNSGFACEDLVRGRNRARIQTSRKVLSVNSTHEWEETRTTGDGRNSRRLHHSPVGAKAQKRSNDSSACVLVLLANPFALSLILRKQQGLASAWSLFLEFQGQNQHPSPTLHCKKADQHPGLQFVYAATLPQNEILLRNRDNSYQNDKATIYYNLGRIKLDRSMSIRHSLNLARGVFSSSATDPAGVSPGFYCFTMLFIVITVPPARSIVEM